MVEGWVHEDDEGLGIIKWDIHGIYMRECVGKIVENVG